MKILKQTAPLLFSMLLGLQANAADLTKTVTLQDGRTILANQAGLTLYTFDVDGPGVSNCHGGCLTVWPAIIVTDEQEVEAPFSVTQRPSGELQLMLDQKPLYLFVGDKRPGDILGDNLQNVWHIIEVDQPEVLSSESL